MGVKTTGGEYCAEGSATGVEEVVLGVDTRLDFHVAMVLDHLGRRLGESKVPTTTGGYRSLLSWAEGFGPVRCAGVEGTGSYGAGLARYLKSTGITVMEVERPKRRHLKRNGKSDPKDAEAAARAVLAGETAGEPKSADGQVEMIRVLRAARCSAVKARSQAANQLQALRVTPPEKLQRRLCGLSTSELVATAARFRPGNDPDGVETATKFALRSMTRRHEALSEEIAELDAQLDRLVAEVAPGLISLPAIGTHHAATLLVVAGTTPSAWAAKLLSPASAGSRPSMPPRAKWSGIGSTAAATGMPTGPCT
jgi:transposase